MGEGQRQKRYKPRKTELGLFTLKCGRLLKDPTEKFQIVEGLGAIIPEAPFPLNPPIQNKGKCKETNKA